MNDLIMQAGESDDSPISIFIMGATATGKTDLALAIYDELPSELISVDSALVYRTMDIGTAKPDPWILDKSPHHLIDIIDPAEVYSAGQFREDALALTWRICPRSLTQSDRQSKRKRKQRVFRRCMIG